MALIRISLMSSGVEFCHVFFCSNKDCYVVFSFHPVYVALLLILFNFFVLKYPCNPEISLTWSYCIFFSYTLNSIFEYLVEGFYINVHKRY